MVVTETFHAPDRSVWRLWLAENHARKTEIWLVNDKGRPSVGYLEAVEEALCFGWIDGLAKRLDPGRTAQRFTPRRKRSHWTELNKQRARRLIDEERMTESGLAVLPDLTLRPLELAPDVLAALNQDPETWRHFQAFPEAYKRIRIGYIEEMRRDSKVFRSRLENFVKKTRQNKQFGVTR